MDQSLDPRLADALAGTDRPVVVDLYADRDRPNGTIARAERLVAAADDLSLSVDPPSAWTPAVGLCETPVAVIRRESGWPGGVRHHGTAGESAARSRVGSALTVSTGVTGLGRATVERLSTLEGPRDLCVFVDHDDPACRRPVRVAHDLAAAADGVVASVVDVDASRPRGALRRRDGATRGRRRRRRGRRRPDASGVPLRSPVGGVVTRVRPSDGPGPRRSEHDRPDDTPTRDGAHFARGECDRTADDQVRRRERGRSQHDRVSLHTRGVGPDGEKSSGLPCRLQRRGPDQVWSWATESQVLPRPVP